MSSYNSELDRLVDNLYLLESVFDNISDSNLIYFFCRKYRLLMREIRFTNNISLERLIKENNDLEKILLVHS